MNIRKKTTKLMSLLLSFAMAFSGVIPAYAMENTSGNSMTVIDGEDVAVTHKHNYVATITKEPTCTEKGEKIYTCTCGDSYAEEISAKGHHYENGECTDCHEKDPNHENSYTEEIPATGHHYGDDDKCTECGELNPDHEHGYIEKVVKEPTCTETGEKTYTCGCGHSYTEELPATGHHYENGECTGCGENDPSHIHNYNEGVVTKEPTCTENGEMTFLCSECGYSSIEGLLATGHNYIVNRAWEDTSNGTYKFVQNGNKWISNNKGVQSSTATSTWTITLANDAEYSFKYKVSSETNCDKLTITIDSTTVANAISGAGTEQTFTTTLKAGTHTLTASYVKDYSQNKNDDCGYVILEDIADRSSKCQNCGEIDSNHVHSYNDGEITKEPTCTELGEKIYICNCGHSYTQEVSATGHNYENNICTNCGEIDPSHVHNYISYEFTVEPTLVSSLKNNKATAVREWTLSSSNDEYESYYTAIIHPGSNRTNSCITTATFEINLPDDYEGEFDYRYGYACKPNSSAALSNKRYVIAMKINGDQVYQNYSGSISGAASNNTTIPLKAGKNTFTVQYSGYTSLNSYSISDTSTATLTMYKCPLYDRTQYHICNDCGKKEEHYFNEGVVTKEATCVEVGEKTYTCNICDGKYVEEIPAKGHNYVNGMCTMCGDLNTGVEQIFNVSAKTTKQSVTSATNPDAHYEITTLADTYSDNIEILEDMLDGEYLRINYYVYFPTLGTQSYYGERDDINGLWQVQKYNEETNIWENVYQKYINYDNIKGLEETEDRFNLIAPHGKCFFKKFELEQGTYRVHCKFYAKSGICNKYNHPHYDCNVIASLCQRNRN